jgi:hypothetical protein
VSQLIHTLKIYPSTGKSKMTGFLKMALLGMVVALSAFCSSAQSIGTHDINLDPSPINIFH